MEERAGWQTAPEEIVRLAFVDTASPDAFRAVRLVCRRWESAAQDRLRRGLAAVYLRKWWHRVFVLKVGPKAVRRTSLAALARDVLVPAGVCYVIARRGSGKTTAAREICRAVADRFGEVHLVACHPCRSHEWEEPLVAGPEWMLHTNAHKYPFWTPDKPTPAGSALWIKDDADYDWISRHRDFLEFIRDECVRAGSDTSFVMCTQLESSLAQDETELRQLADAGIGVALLLGRAGAEITRGRTLVSVLEGIWPDCGFSSLEEATLEALFELRYARNVRFAWVAVMCCAATGWKPEIRFVG